jgi:hypothetical protein
MNRINSSNLPDLARRELLQNAGVGACPVGFLDEVTEQVSWLVRFQVGEMIPWVQMGTSLAVFKNGVETGCQGRPA